MIAPSALELELFLSRTVLLFLADIKRQRYCVINVVHNIYFPTHNPNKSISPLILDVFIHKPTIHIRAIFVLL
jgi:hypothetical protein